MGIVVSIPIFRMAARAGCNGKQAVLAATLTPGACQRLAAAMERQHQYARIRYDSMARQLRASGLDVSVLGPRP